MADTDALKKYLDAGMAFTHLTRARAEQVVKDLVAAGELQRNQAKGAIDDLLERSRKNAETLSEQVRKEVDSQLASLGLARKADVERLEAELAEMKGGGKGSGGEQPSKPPPVKKAAKKSSGDGQAKATQKEPKAASDGGGEAPSDHSTPAKRAGKSSGATKAAKPVKQAGGDSGGGAMDHSSPAKKAAPAKKTSKKQG